MERNTENKAICFNCFDPIISISCANVFQNDQTYNNNNKGLSFAGVWFIILQCSRQIVVFMINCVCVQM